MANLLDLLYGFVGNIVHPQKQDTRPQWERDLEKMRSGGGWNPEPSPTPAALNLWDTINSDDRSRILKFMGGQGPLSDDQVRYALKYMGGMSPSDELYDNVARGMR